MNVFSSSRTICEKFDKRRIVASLLRETEIDNETAKKIARSVERQLKERNIENVSTLEIRDLVRNQLFKRGYIKDAKNYETIGLPIYEIRKMLSIFDRDNANLQDNPETFHKKVADNITKDFALTLLPTEISRAHLVGDIHIHDLEYFASRSLNCLQHSLLYYIKYGLKVDGTGEHTSAASSAKNIETLVNHAGQALMAAQNNMSGGQSYSLFNVFLAPFAENIEYERIKQAMQMFIFNVNMSYCSRGGQSVFSTISLDFNIPEFLEDEPAYGPGGERCGVYGDYLEEARLILKAITEVHMEGDSLGKPHLFPNTIYNLDNRVFNDGECIDLLDDVISLSQKYSIPYFMRQEGGDNFTNAMGCRTRLSTNWTGDWDTDCLRTGNTSYITINIPRLGFFEDPIARLYKNLELSREAIEIRLEQAKKLMKLGKLKFLTQENDGGPLYRIENGTLTFGVVGLHEYCQNIGIEDGIISKEGQKETHEILRIINEYAAELKDETGLRWTVIQTPAETTAYRFAQLDIKEYPGKVNYQGSVGNEYYTNSTHVPVSAGLNLVERIKIEEQYHELTMGGHIHHVWLGERGNKDAIRSLTEKIYKNSKIGFWALSSVNTYCFNCCKIMSGKREKCLYCGDSENIEWYDRITGYLQQVGRKKDSTGGWNPGKYQEFLDRKRW